MQLRAAWYGRTSTKEPPDPTALSPPEGLLTRPIFQALDQYEVEKLSRETRRGQRENVRQGFSSGGRPPYGFRFESVPHPDTRRAALGDIKSRLIPYEDEARVV